MSQLKLLVSDGKRNMSRNDEPNPPACHDIPFLRIERQAIPTWQQIIDSSIDDLDFRCFSSLSLSRSVIPHLFNKIFITDVRQLISDAERLEVRCSSIFVFLNRPTTKWEVTWKNERVNLVARCCRWIRNILDYKTSSVNRRMVLRRVTIHRGHKASFLVSFFKAISVVYKVSSIKMSKPPRRTTTDRRQLLMTYKSFYKKETTIQSCHRWYGESLWTRRFIDVCRCLESQTANYWIHDVSCDGHSLYVIGDALHSRDYVQGEKVCRSLLVRQCLLSVQVRYLCSFSTALPGSLFILVSQCFGVPPIILNNWPTSNDCHSQSLIWSLSSELFTFQSG